MSNKQDIDSDESVIYGSEIVSSSEREEMMAEVNAEEQKEVGFVAAAVADQKVLSSTMGMRLDPREQMRYNEFCHNNLNVSVVVEEADEGTSNVDDFSL